MPLAPRLRQFIRDPRPVLALLEQLKADPELMVRRSVANNLNDIAKDHPDLVVETLTAWRNTTEIWFSILVRRVIKRGNFTSQDDPRAKILAFVEYFNRMAKPFRWTYTGRPLQV